MSDNKKATIGATMTWVIATMIILFVIIFFIYASYSIAKEEKLLGFDRVIQEKKNSNVDAEQTLLAILQTEIDGLEIRGYISQGRYSEIKNQVDLILEELELDGSKALVYIGDKKVVFDDGVLEVENDKLS